MQLEKDFGVSISLQSVQDDGPLKFTSSTSNARVCLQCHKGVIWQKIDVIFFDATTLYFESFEEDEFSLGARLKNQKAAIKKQVLDLNDYKSHSEDSQVRLKDIPLDENHRLIVSHSAVRARKDVYDREKAIKKLTEKLKKSKDVKSLISNYGYKKYLNIKSSFVV